MNKSFTVIPDTVMFNTELDIYERVVLMYLIKKSTLCKGKRFFEYNSKMVRMLAMSESSVKRCTKVLKEKGYINITTEKNTNYFEVNNNKIENATAIPFNSKIPSGYTGIVVDIENENTQKIAAYIEPKIKTLEIENDIETENKNAAIASNNVVDNDEEVFYKINKMQNSDSRLYWRNELKNIVTNEQLDKYRKMKLIQFMQDEQGKKFIYFNTDEYKKEDTRVENNSETENNNTLTQIDFDALKAFENNLFKEQRDMLWGIRKRYKNNGKKPIIYKEYAKEKKLSKEQNDILTFLKNSKLIKLWKDKFTGKYVFKPCYDNFLKK